MRHPTHGRLPFDHRPARTARGLGTLFVLGGLALTLAADNLGAQEANPGRPDEAVIGLEAIMNEVQVRRRNVADAAASLESIRANPVGAATEGERERQRLERRLEQEQRLLRAAEDRLAALRRSGAERVPLDGQPVTVGIDTGDDVIVRVRSDLPQPPAVRAGAEQDIARLESEIRDLHVQWADAGGDAMTEAERDRAAGRLEQARDHAEEVMTELRIAEQSGLGPRHPHMLELRDELASAEARIRSLQRRVQGDGRPAPRREVGEQIEQRLARLDRLRTRVAGVSDRPFDRTDARDGRDGLGNRVAQLERAVEELDALLPRHRVDERRVVRAMQEVDLRRGDNPLPPPRDAWQTSPDGERAAVTPALQSQIAEMRRQVAAVSEENNRLRQHAEAMQKALAEHERLRRELTQRLGSGGYVAPPGGQDVWALQAENAGLRREADQLRAQLGELRAAYEQLRRGVYMR